METAVEERHHVLCEGTAELDKQLLLPTAEGRLLSTVEHQDELGHLLKGGERDNTVMK